MADIQLYYFPVRGRAEPIRMTLAAAGKKFDDVRLTGEQWAAQKDKSPYGQMPYLVYKGKTYGESKAIASFVARECGLAGKTTEDAMRVDEVFCLAGSLLEGIGKVHFEKDAAAKEEKQKELMDVTIPKYLRFFENMLAENKTGFFVGKEVTQADLSVYDITDTLLKQNPKMLDCCKEIQKMRKNVEANKTIKAYLDSRPASDMVCWRDVDRLWNHAIGGPDSQHPVHPSVYGLEKNPTTPHQKTMSGIKLYYFPVRARAEAVRMSFAAAGKKYEDIKITQEQWKTEKEKSPYGQLPYLVYKGKTYGESKAIASFVARECGLAGKTNEDALRVDEVFCLVGSLMDNMGKAHFEKDPATKETLQKELGTVTIPKYLGYFEKMLKESGSGFVVGKALTQADLTVYDITFSLLKRNAKVLDNFPEIQKMRKNVEANKNVKAYLAARPDTEF
ncbi:uncharacterized protein LOC143300008 [Babylonia areolata]|uniref:uncharacterized protein LOC143300008 n=1 Tax=Babylonia areolata TaxID=304850 RepID=UPI003FD3C3CC